MTEQTYMKLGDKVNRPKFDVNKIDVNHPRFKRLVDEYVRWYQDVDYTFDKRERYEEDILSCLEEFSLDRKSTRLNSSHSQQSRMPSSA